MARHPVNLEAVLANVRPGRVVRLVLTQEQKRALRDRDGQIALDVFRHLLGARPDWLERFPLTERAVQAIARRLGHTIGQKRARRMVARLIATGVAVRAGHYRQPYRNLPMRSGFRVALFRLGVGLRDVRPATRKRPVGTPAPVKRNIHQRWWQHPLFGASRGFRRPRYHALERRG